MYCGFHGPPNAVFQNTSKLDEKPLWTVICHRSLHSPVVDRSGLFFVSIKHRKGGQCVPLLYTSSQLSLKHQIDEKLRWFSHSSRFFSLGCSVSVLLWTKLFKFGKNVLSKSIEKKENGVFSPGSTGYGTHFVLAEIIRRFFTLWLVKDGELVSPVVRTFSAFSFFRFFLLCICIFVIFRTVRF